jgi:starch-binding outer membrane protein, SusD/RagB family
MKKFKYMIPAICLTTMLCMVSCTNLDEVAYSSIPIDKFLVNEENLVKYAGRAYTSLQRYPEEFSIWTLNEIASDEMVAPGRDDGFVWDNGRWNEIHTHTVSSTNKINSEAWNFVFQGISACNEIIYTMEGSEYTFPEKDRVIVEIELVRAYYYYLAMDNWGNVPFTIDFTDKSLPVQKDRKFIFSYIEKTITDNVDKLQAQPDPKYYGRVTQGMAYTLLAKLYLNAKEWIGEDKYQQSVDACDKVIALNAYQIEDDYFANFKTHNEPSLENIFVIPMQSIYTKDRFYWYTLTLNDASRATFGFKGVMWDEFILEPGFLNKYADDDLRKKSFLYGQQKDKAGNDIIIDGVPFIYTPTVANYMARKKWEGARCAKYEYQVDLEYYVTDMENDFVLFRYSDVLYTKLEALWRLGHGDEMLNDPQLQKIRTRAGLAPLQNSDLTTTGLLDEFGREFAWEGRRRQDQIRFGVYGAPGWNKPPSGPNAKLFPIPQTILGTNSNLVQNPQ